MARYEKRGQRLPRRILCKLDPATFEQLCAAAADRQTLANIVRRQAVVTIEGEARRALTGALRLGLDPEPQAPRPWRSLVIDRPSSELVTDLVAAARRHGLAPFDASGRLIAAYLRVFAEILGMEPE